MTNIAVEDFKTDPIIGTGFRIDWNLTKEDVDDGVHVELEVGATVAGTAPTGVGGTTQVDTLTFPAVAAIADSDYVILTDTNGDEWAAAAQLYPAAVPQVDTLQFAAKAAMTDGEYVIIEDQAGLEWAIAADFTGASAAPTGARWLAVNAARRAQVDISLIATAEEVGDAFITAFNLLAGFNAAVTLSDEITDGFVGVTQIVGGTCLEPTTLLPDDLAMGSVVIAQVTDGADITVAPTGARWVAVPGAQKAQVDLSAATTAADVAAAFELALDALAAATIVTDDSAADGTMTCTQPARGPVTNPEPFDSGDTGTGTITTAPTTPGVASSVALAADTLTLAVDPGWLTGKSAVLTTSGAAPTGLVSGTTYYMIRTGAGVYQFASSLANALAGTDIDITALGAEASVLTLTAGAGVVGYLFNSMEKLTDAELSTAITTAEFYDVNAAAAAKYMVAQVGFNFSALKKARIFIKPGETFDGFTLPDEFLPHMTLRLDNESLKFVETKITRRGVK